jgi:biopolymer transport protein TolR
VPMMRKAIDVQLPDPTPQPNQTTVQPDQIVLQVLPNSQYKINSEAVTKDNLGKRLKEIFEPRPDKIIFVKGDTTVTYQDVIYGMDMSRGAGVKVIGIPPKDVAK